MPRNTTARARTNNRVRIAGVRAQQQPLWADLPLGTIGTNVDPKTGRTHVMRKVFGSKKAAGGFRLMSLNDAGLVCSPKLSKNWDAYQRPASVISTGGYSITVSV